ncbi:MAG: hypothetical protein EAZ81_05120 [Verrucomicrobia bacterium]|nr:MAG: hypothetical protein EAZ81_05120 [Verrucomicrobiota bacterium]
MVEMVADYRFDYGHDYDCHQCMVISKGKLKAKMLEYFREVERTGESLIVTDHGRAVLEVRPVMPQMASKADMIAKLRSQLFGGKAADAIESDRIMEPEWSEGDEADDAWWTNPEASR